MDPYHRIQAITFDVGGTLIDPWPSVGHVYAAVAARHGHPDLPVTTLNQNFAAVWRTKGEFNYTRDEWAGVVARTFAGVVGELQTRSFFPDIYECFAGPDVWRVHPDVIPALEELAGRGYPLAVISNWDDRLRPLLTALKLAGFFDLIVVSCEVGFTKPSPVIFEVAAQRLGLQPSTMLHVGDGEADDYRGAQAAGCSSLLLNRNRPPDDGHIQRLETLCALLSNG